MNQWISKLWLSQLSWRHLLHAKWNTKCLWCPRTDWLHWDFNLTMFFRLLRPGSRRWFRPLPHLKSNSTPGRKEHCCFCWPKYFRNWKGIVLSPTLIIKWNPLQVLYSSRCLRKCKVCSSPSKVRKCGNRLRKFRFARNRLCEFLRISWWKSQVPNAKWSQLIQVLLRIPLGNSNFLLIPSNRFLQKQAKFRSKRVWGAARLLAKSTFQLAIWP